MSIFSPTRRKVRRISIIYAWVKGGILQPWVELVTNDLCVLFQFLPRVFEHMLPPWVDAAPYWILAAEFPNEWANIVSLYCTTVDDVHASECMALSESPHPPKCAPHRSLATFVTKLLRLARQC